MNEENQYHVEFNKLATMYKIIIALLLGIVISGFTFVYMFHARVSVLEYVNAQGPRFTQFDFNNFKETYEEFRINTATRLSTVELLTQETSKAIVEINLRVKFIAEKLGDNRKFSNPELEQ